MYGREGDMIFCQVFFLSPLHCTVTCMSLKKHKSQGKAVEVSVNSKEANSEDFCLDFIQESGLRAFQTYSCMQKCTLPPPASV